jgi:putative DNA methylase
MTKRRKKLIEVALPLEAINKASAREKGIRPVHPSAMHMWWARRPLAAARAVILAQMVDDPSANPDLFPTEAAQLKERQRLFKLIEQIVQWENTTNDEVIERARSEIWHSWRGACADNVDHPSAKELFDPHRLPAFHDPFAGGGALPFEAQRLGLAAYAGDLNPVAVLICKAMIEIPPKFAGRPPVNPRDREEKSLVARQWKASRGLLRDVRYYAEWVCGEAEKRIGDLYPKFEITPELVSERPDLKKYEGRKLTVIAWLWARTVKSPNPAFANSDVPLTSSFLLCTKPGKEAYVEPVMEGTGYHFTVKVGKSKDPLRTKYGTKLSRGVNFECLMSKAPIAREYICSEANAGRMSSRMMAIVAEGDRERVYLPPTPQQEAVLRKANPEWKPEVEFFTNALGFRVANYGMKTWSDLFSSRQLVTLVTLSDLVQKARERVKIDALDAGLPDRGALSDGGTGAIAYADAVGTYLALGMSKATNRANTLATWMIHEQCPGHLFRRHAIPMSWDFCEANTISGPSGSFWSLVDDVARALEFVPTHGVRSFAIQEDAAHQTTSFGKVISTDPPYYDNIGYADLSDFYYVWLRRTLKPVFPELFATLTTPKDQELVATPDRHGGKYKAESFFLAGMTEALHKLAEQAHPAFPLTIYYAFKQVQTDSKEGTARTGWETFLDAVIRAGLAITGTWPIRTERENRSRNQESNALASSIILVCCKRSPDAAMATRREFVSELKAELPVALAYLQKSNIVPVDLAQAAIGPGMAIYTKYANVTDASGKRVSVREALALINQVLDEVLVEQEGDFDPETRWAVAWFEQQGFSEGEFGVAETLSKAKNTSVAGMVEANILSSKRGKVRLLKPEELTHDWDPAADPRLTAWEMVHQLIRSLEVGGENAAVSLVAKLGTKAEVARELAYRLYTIAERKKRAAEALSYNGLVQSWPEIMRLTREATRTSERQPELFA